MGSIHKRQRTRADGTSYHVWQAITRLPNGKQTAKTERRKVDAERWLKETEANALKGTAVATKRGKTPYAELLDRWLKAHRHDGRRPSSVARDESYVKNHVRPRWEEWQLVAIERADVQEWVNELADSGLAPATVRKVYNLFSASLEWAVDERYLGVSPCQRIALPKVKPTRMRFLTPGEVGRLADAMDERYRALVLVGGYAGLRIGELVALHREDVDLAKRQVRVTRTASWVKGHLHLNEPKTAAGRRSVGLPAFVAEALAEHLEGHAGETIVFPAPGGGYLQPTLFRARQFVPAVKEAKLEPLRIHDLRHTAVSLWIASGADAKRVAARAGHSSVAFTLDRYGHLFPDTEDDLMGRLHEVGTAAEAESNVVSLR